MPSLRTIVLLLAGAAGMAVALLLGALIVVRVGMFDVSADSPHAPLIGKFIHRTMIHSVARRASPAMSSGGVSASNVQSGFCEYREHCETCHGAPAVGRPEWVNGMNPTPPYLIDARTRWSRDELTWIIRNGIKMTAMPAWKKSMSDDEIRDVVTFIEVLPQLSSPTYADWANGGVCTNGKDDRR
jgi:cytochrome c5